jgi:hypothetical protein
MSQMGLVDRDRNITPVGKTCATFVRVVLIFSKVLLSDVAPRRVGIMNRSL